MSASYINGIDQVLSEVVNQQALKTKVEKWLKGSTPEQLAVLDEALDSFGSMSSQERFVVASALEPLTYRVGPTSVIHEILALRAAFCSPWSVANTPGSSRMDCESYVLGLRGDKGRTPIELGDERTVRESIALLRFAYELRQRAPRGCNYLPVRVARIGVERLVYRYESEDLRRLIISEPHRVGELIEHALNQETCDPQRLSVLMGYSGPSSLTYGVL